MRFLRPRRRDEGTDLLHGLGLEEQARATPAAFRLLLKAALHARGLLIGALLPLLMSQEERVEERTALRERLTEDAQVLIDQLDTIKTNMEDLTPGDEEHQAQLQMGQAIAQQLQAFQQEAIALEDAKTAEQLEQCYRELVEAVNVVADRKKIDTVFRFIPTDDEFTKGDSSAAMRLFRSSCS